jgi:hypothetical protein
LATDRARTQGWDEPEISPAGGSTPVFRGDGLVADRRLTRPSYGHANTERTIRRERTDGSAAGGDPALA